MIDALTVVVIFEAFVIGFLASYFYGKLKMVHEQIVLIISILGMMTDEMLGDVSVEKKKKGKK
jgi:MFS-type transporter involved in bile tolerance (Atg22 family)